MTWVDGRRAGNPRRSPWSAERLRSPKCLPRQDGHQAGSGAARYGALGDSLRNGERLGAARASGRNTKRRNPAHPENPRVCATFAGPGRSVSQRPGRFRADRATTPHPCPGTTLGAPAPVPVHRTHDLENFCDIFGEIRRKRARGRGSCSYWFVPNTEGSATTDIRSRWRCCPRSPASTSRHR